MCYICVYIFLAVLLSFFLSLKTYWPARARAFLRLKIKRDKAISSTPYHPFPTTPLGSEVPLSEGKTRNGTTVRSPHGSGMRDSQQFITDPRIRDRRRVLRTALASLGQPAEVETSSANAICATEELRTHENER